MSRRKPQERLTLTALPKTIKVAVELSKKETQLSDYHSFDEKNNIYVDSDLSLLSKVSEKQKVNPSEVASATLVWYLFPEEGFHIDEGDIENEMIDDMEKQLKKAGLNPDDFDYDLDYPDDADDYDEDDYEDD